MSRLPVFDLADEALAGTLPGKSLAIAAGAGSGKTFTLVTLVLGFLGREDNRAFDVMATTFGREAAADLKARILGPLDVLAHWDQDRWNEALAAFHESWSLWDSRLNTWSAPGEIALAARQWGQGSGGPAWAASAAKARAHWLRARREAEGMDVSTIHGLALDVLRRAGESGEGLLQADDPRLVSLLRRAGREALELPDGHEDHLPARKLLAWLEGVEASKSRWERVCEAFDAHTDALGNWRVETNSEDTSLAFWEELHGWIEAYRPFGEEPLRAAQLTKKNAPHGNFQKYGLQKIVGAPSSQAPRSECLRFAEALAASIPDGQGKLQTYYSEGFNEAMEPLRLALPDLLEHWLSLLLERVFRRFEALKHERRWLSYGDLVRRAAAHVGKTPLARIPKLLLVDEFQDINPVQESFLNALGAEATVVVGDPKQAIYGFRGGVAGLLETRITDASKQGLAFRLPRNHRSTAPVVEMANAFVSQVVPLMDEGALDPDGEQEHSGLGLGEPLVALARVDSERPRAADLSAAASWIASLSVEAGWQGLGMVELPCRGRRRRALLLPRRSGLPALRRALQQRGVEPLVQTRDGFWESPGIRLMMSLLECIAHPQRPLPFLSVLRSPWIGARDADLLGIASALKNGWPSLELQLLPPLLRDGVEWLQGLRKVSAQRLFAEGITRPGLLEFIAATFPHGSLEPERAGRNLEQFLGMLPDLPSDLVAAFAFLDRLRARPRGDAPANGTGADLLIQTIHGSKGLEYEDVLLPMLNYTVKGIRKGEVGRRGNLGYLLLGWKLGKFPATGHRELKVEEDRRVLREGLNLMYVALTRAKHRMVLLHQWGWSKEDENFIPPLSASALIADGKKPNWPQVASEFAALIPGLPRFDTAPAQAARERVEPSILRAAPLPISRPPATVPPDPGDAEGRSLRRRHGMALHGLLREVLVRLAVDPTAAETHLSESPLCAAWPGAADRVRCFLKAFAERGWDRFPRRTEFPLRGAAISGGTGFADLVVWEPDRMQPVRIHVVDFKLAAEIGELQMDAYRLQLDRYRVALAQMHPKAEVGVWLYSIEKDTFLEMT